MEPLSPQRIYATVDIRSDPRALARVERMAAAMDGPPIEWVDEDRLVELVAERGWDRGARWGTIAQPHDPDVVFTMGQFDPPEALEARAKRWPALTTFDLLGHSMFRFRPDGTPEFKKRTHGIICQSAYQLHSITGCMYRCAYCGCGTLIRVLANMEAYVEQLDGWLETDPALRLYKWDNVTDVTPFEPEYGGSKLLVEYFAGRTDQYLEIYVGKSANIDSLLDLDHRGQTILQWSVSGHTQASKIEPRTAGSAERIEAARRCQQAGYIVRFRFSPIVPVRNWREENAELIDLIFRRTCPDVISLCAFGWMDYEGTAGCIDMALIDPDYAAAMKASAPFLEARAYNSGGGHPIPHDARFVMFDFLIDEIQKRSPNTVVALCLETPEMWRVLGDKIGQKPGNYVCNCGPQCTPGDPMYDRLVGTAPLCAPA